MNPNAKIVLLGKFFLICAEIPNNIWDGKSFSISEQISQSRVRKNWVNVNIRRYRWEKSLYSSIKSPPEGGWIVWIVMRQKNIWRSVKEQLEWAGRRFCLLLRWGKLGTTRKTGIRIVDTNLWENLSKSKW